MRGRVLVADGDVERGRAIARACEERGFECHTTSHGASSLEAALAEVPEAVVCQLRLPLIDGRRLASILRANPRTHGVVFVFVADRPGEELGDAAGAPVIPAPAEPDVVAGCVAARLEERDQVREPGEVEGGGMEGELVQLPLLDLLQLFHVSRKTGTVDVRTSPGPGVSSKGRITLRRGDIAAASAGEVHGEKALFRLLTWERGSFAFRPHPVEGDPSIQKPTRTLLREGQRQLAEWQRLSIELPPLSAQVHLRVPRASLPNVIHPLTQEVLVVLDLYARVQEVVDHCSYPDYHVLRTLHTLVQRGMVELRPEPEGPELADEARLVSAARAARLREWLELDRPGLPGQRQPKVAVVAAQPGALRDFSRLLARLPGFEPAGEAAAGGGRLGPLGRLAIEADLALEWIALPGDARHAPVWPLAGHRALATLLLLEGAVGPAVEALREPAGVLGALPGARIFHLLLLEKGQKVAVEELRANLSLVDDGSLMLLPAEQPQQAERLLRELLGRILP